jgi:hypothetical protein
LIQIGRWVAYSILAISLVIVAPAKNKSFQVGESEPKPPSAPPEGLARRDANSVAFCVHGNKAGHNGDPSPFLVLHDFSFEGTAVPVDEMHLAKLSEGCAARNFHSQNWAPLLNG